MAVVVLAPGTMLPESLHDVRLSLCKLRITDTIVTNFSILFKILKGFILKWLNSVFM